MTAIITGGSVSSSQNSLIELKKGGYEERGWDGRLYGRAPAAIVPNPIFKAVWGIDYL